ncbi:hypothetical protein LSUE1_G000248 [Lachnellula suecica]|uniref:ER membrane protein complex subunit 10 n=1 Tax=Lachnellula suecica TaxID=602035 RepID=A0A8T9CHQ3_9HELO|nr:hypothetical protein LSUE1_G000248 [Lachnellula suecica]
MKMLLSAFVLFPQAVRVIASTEFTESTTISIQSIGLTATPINTLAEIGYNPSTLSAEILSFESPELSIDSKLLRIGVYDAATSTWKSSTSTTSVDSFSKGYSPTFVLSLDAQGGVIGVTCKSARIDAGQTRDFGPKVVVSKVRKGKLPELNRPVVLSAEGKVDEPVPEKTMLQKYWWVLLGGVMLLMTAGGGNDSIL